MMIVAFKDGLGNQMYMYALYMALKKTYPDQIFKIDVITHDWRINTSHWHGYKYILDKFFGLELPLATYKEIKGLSPCIIVPSWLQKYFPKKARLIHGYSIAAKARAALLPSYRKRRDKNFITELTVSAFNGNVFDLDANKDYYFYGNWQNINYIRWPNIEQDVRKAFVFKSIGLQYHDKILLAKIMRVVSVGIHVRVYDDFAENQDHTKVILKTVKLDYYRKAIEAMEEKLGKQGINEIHYFVFSNNVNYCEQTFSFLSNVEYIGHSQDKCDIDMFLMSKCRHAIISASTFAFWAAFITDNEEKIVISPKYHLRGKTFWNEMSIPERWIKIDNMKLNLKDIEMFWM
jgi:hypothetical protein